MKALRMIAARARGADRIDSIMRDMEFLPLGVHGVVARRLRYVPPDPQRIQEFGSCALSSSSVHSQPCRPSPFACSAPAGEEEQVGNDALEEREEREEREEEEMEEQAACSADARAESEAQLAKAVSAAADRVAGRNVCVGTTVVDIVRFAQNAVAACPAARATIATSPSTKDVRTALKDNFALTILSGRFQTHDARGERTWAGLGTALEGSTFYGPSSGAFGPQWTLTFSAGGKLTRSTLLVDEAGRRTWTDTAGTYAVGTATSDGWVRIDVTVTGEGTRTYEMTNTDGDDVAFPSFEMSVGRNASEALHSIPSECEA